MKPFKRATIHFFLAGFLTAPAVTAKEQPWLTSLISQLDDASPALTVLNRLPATAGERAKTQALAGRFRQQTFLKPNWVINKPEKREPDYHDQRAVDALQGKIWTMYGTEELGDRLPWYDPKKRVRTLARFPHFDYLAPAYFHTQDERYAQLMVRHMEDFLQEAPIEKAADVSVHDDYRSNPWNWVLLLWRIARWIDTLDFLQNSSSLSDATYLRILDHLWKEADWLVPRMNLGLHNGTIANARSILYAGLTFRDAKQSRFWEQEGLGTYKAFLSSYFYPGEVSIELTLGYSAAVLSQGLGVYEGLPAEQRRPIRPLLEDLVDGHFGLMKPDRSLPRYGDHGAYDIRPQLLEKAAVLFNRPDYQAVVDNTTHTISPLFLSWPRESNTEMLSGYYAMRDGWSKTAQYLSIDAGPFGTNHQHGDKLSITLSADGAEFIVDPGTSVYNSTKPGPRYDLRFGYLHNVMTIDGVDPNAGWDQHYQFDTRANRWITNPRYDFLSSVYDFRANNLDALAQRSVLYLRGEYWILFDDLMGNGKHEVESNFQFAIDTELELKQGEVYARAANGAQLNFSTWPPDLDRDVVVADTVFRRTTFPLRSPNIDHKKGGRGWVGTFGNHSPIDEHQSHPAPALLFSGSREFPMTFVHVLRPSQEKRLSPVSLELLKKSSKSHSFKITHLGIVGRVDYLQWKTGRPIPKGDMNYTPTGGTWIRTDNDHIEEIIVLNRQEVTWEQGVWRVEIAFSADVEGHFKREGGNWTFYLDEFHDSPVHITRFDLTADGELTRIRQVVDSDGSAVPLSAFEFKPGLRYVLR